jgi:hypothetical protein
VNATSKNWNGLAGFLLVFVLMAFCPVAKSQSLPPDYLTSGEGAAWMIGQGIGQGLNEAAHDITQMHQNNAEASVEIQKARERYWNAYRTKSADLPAAEKDFANKLASKDLYYLQMLILANGYVQSLPGHSQDRINSDQLDKFTGSVDGGIRKAAWPEFVTWMESVQDQMHGSPTTDFSVGLERYLGAMINSTSSKEYKAYKFARDCAEFDATGIQLSPKDFLAFLYLRENEGSAEAAAKDYKNDVDKYGEALMLQIADKIRKAPLDDRGLIADPESVGIAKIYSWEALLNGRPKQNDTPVPAGLVPSADWSRYGILHALLDSHMPVNREYVIRLISGIGTEPVYRRGGIFYTNWASVYGEDILSNLAGRIRSATKTVADGGIYDPKAIGVRSRDPAYAFMELLYQQPLDDKKKFLRMIAEHDAANNVVDSHSDLEAKYDELASTYGEKEMFHAMYWAWSGGYTAVINQLEIDASLVNPEYHAWAGFQLGDKVVYYDDQTKMPPPMQSLIEGVRYSFTLKALDGEKAIISETEQVSSRNHLAANERHDDDICYFATNTDGLATFAKGGTSAGDLISKGTLILNPGKYEGKEVLQINGSKLVCRLYLSSKDVTTGPFQGIWQIKVWICDDIPGGIVGMQSYWKSQLMISTMLVSFKTSKPIHVEPGLPEAKLGLAPNATSN